MAERAMAVRLVGAVMGAVVKKASSAKAATPLLPTPGTTVLTVPALTLECLLMRMDGGRWFSGCEGGKTMLGGQW